MTLNAFVIGHPIAHSRSPLIHGYWLKSHGIDGCYQPIDVAPETLKDFIARLKQGEFAGGNVTIPHKQAVLPFCDALDEAAVRAGAVNTLVVTSRGLEGRNTDLYGFVANLDEKIPGWDKTGSAIVLGAGGAARAVIAGLLERGLRQIVVLNRTESSAQALAATFGPTVVPAGLDAFGDHAPKAGLLINTTAVGMHGSAFNNLALEALPKTALVTDIVYTPLETPLLGAARACGLRTADGLGMLLHQAVPGFEAWFGIRPEVTPELRTLVERDLGLL
jgi:shikimate dehydrogenase